MRTGVKIVVPFALLACSGEPAESTAPAGAPDKQLAGLPEAPSTQTVVGNTTAEMAAEPGAPAPEDASRGIEGPAQSPAPEPPESAGNEAVGEGANEAEPSPFTPVGDPPEPEAPVVVEGDPVPESTPPDTIGEGSELLDRLAQLQGLDAAGFAEQAHVAFETLGYDPAEAIGLDTIANSGLGLSEAELGKFQENGFVISTDTVFPHFTYGYQSIYLEDLPVFISADSILYALHTSYDGMLKAIEAYRLYAEVGTMLDRMRANLPASEASDPVRADLDVYLTVAASLLAGEPLAPAASEHTEATTALYDACVAALGEESATVFGSARSVDFSQCAPRGHYTDSAQLSQYFRAMMWLGRIDFRMLEPNSQGELVLDRRQLEAALAARALMDDVARTSHQTIDAVVTAFVGEHDSMTPARVDLLMSDLGITSVADLAALSDEAIVAAILDGGYGAQRIASQIMSGGLGGGTTPLPAAFALLGQRYVIDSHVFSNVVYDRVKGGALERMMPSPLDVAYAALGNDQAGMLLASELESYDYASDLASMRAVVDSESAAFWEMNLYNRWLGALRTLSPGRALRAGEGETLPQIAKTEAWGTRLLNTQLASWAELRHDTLLYAKQSYTSASQCEYPDAYVDPYPEFFHAVGGIAEHALTVMQEQGIAADDSSAGSLEEMLAALGVSEGQRALSAMVEACRTLAEMAEHQRTGAPHSEEHLAFVNRAVTVSSGCGPTMGGGWYGELFPSYSVDWAPTIADVHTQPTTAGGAPVGRVLHVGTGEIRWFVTSVDTCSGPRAYAGLVSSYYERIEEDWNRLTDPDWEAILDSDTLPESPAWVAPLLAQ